jgi:hypothetical protein
VEGNGIGYRTLSTFILEKREQAKKVFRRRLVSFSRLESGNFESQTGNNSQQAASKCHLIVKTCDTRKGN